MFLVEFFIVPRREKSAKCNCLITNVLYKVINVSIFLDIEIALFLRNHCLVFLNSLQIDFYLYDN